MRKCYGGASILLVAGLVLAAAAPATAGHSSQRVQVAIEGITWNVEAQEFEVAHRASKQTATSGEAGGWAVRTTLVIGNGRRLGPVELPLREEGRRSENGGEEPSVAVTTVRLSWDRDGGTMTGPWDVSATSELLNRGRRTIGSPVNLFTTVTEDEKVVGHLSTEFRGGDASHSSHSAADSFKGGPGCSIQCITSGIAYAVGVGAHLKVTTDTLARITITVEGFGSYDSGATLTQTWGKTFPDLEPDTTYKAWAFAIDSSGYVSSASGQFTTLRRFARVEFGGFSLTEYSYNDGFSFYFRANGEWQPQLEEFHHQPALPATLPGVRAVEIADAPSPLNVAVRVFTEENNNEVCEAVDRYNTTDSGGNSCSAWNTGTAGILYIDTYPDDAVEWTGHSLSASATPNNNWEPVQFNAPIEVEVWYA